MDLELPPHRLDVDELVPPEVRTVIRAKLTDRSAEQFDVQLEECLKFLTIVAEDGPRFIPLTREVDDVWHELIVQTRCYFSLCAKLGAGRYIHHESMGLDYYAATRDRVAVAREVVGWVPAYTSRFGPFTSDRASYWTVCNFLRNELGLNLHDINSITC